MTSQRLALYRVYTVLGILCALAVTASTRTHVDPSERVHLDPVESVRLDAPPFEGAWATALAVNEAGDKVAVAWISGNARAAVQVIDIHELSPELLPLPTDRALGLITAIGFDQDTVLALDPRNNRLWRYSLSDREPPSFSSIEGDLSSVQVAFSGGKIQRGARGEIHFSVVSRQGSDAADGEAAFAAAHFRLDDDSTPQLLAAEPLRPVELLNVRRSTGETVRLALPLSSPTVWTIDPIHSRLLVSHNERPIQVIAIDPGSGTRDVLFAVHDAQLLPSGEMNSARERLRLMIAEAQGDSGILENANLDTPSGVTALRVLADGAVLIQRTRWNRTVWVDLYCDGRLALPVELSPQAGRPYPVRVSLSTRNATLYLVVRGQRGESYLERFELPVQQIPVEHRCGF